MQFRFSPLQALLLTLFLFITTFVNAHEVRPAVVDINLDAQGNYKLSIKLNLEAKISRINSKHEDTDDADSTAIYDALREMPAESLAQEFLLFEDYLLEKIKLSFNGKLQKLEVRSIDIPAVGDLELARDSVIHIEGLVPNGTKNLSWKWDPSFGNAVLRVGTASNPELHSSYLLDGKASDLISFNDDCIDAEGTKNSKKGGGCTLENTQKKTPNNAWKAFLNYTQVGFVHIVPKGLDHILFVVGLFLLSATLRPLLIQITTFTLAHSVTLALGIYGIINVSASIVEPLIAASIIYVCIENIYSNKLSRWRPVVVFIFGLLHGLGFASVLKEIGLTSGNYISSLIGFNVGVELGQLTVIAVCFLLVGIWFRNKDWYRSRITIPASVVIAIIAAYWFVERTILV